MTAPAPRSDVLDKEPFRWSDFFLRWEFILALVLAGVMIMGTLISPYFLDIWTLSDATFNFSEKAIIALPMALLILTREIDLSVAAIIALKPCKACFLASRSTFRASATADFRSPEL